MKSNLKLLLSSENMKIYGYKVVDIIVEDFDILDIKSPFYLASREEMDSLFLENASEEGNNAVDVLDFVVEKVLKKSNIISHPQSFSFVPGPSNYINTIADSLATGFNIFSGGWMGFPPAAELEIVTINWLLKLFGLPIKRGGGIFTNEGSMANFSIIYCKKNNV